MRNILLFVIALPIACAAAELFREMRVHKNLVSRENAAEQPAQASTGEPAPYSVEPLALLRWDADVDINLARIFNHRAASGIAPREKQRLRTAALGYYDDALNYRPGDIRARTERLLILIDQGAPLDYALREIDRMTGLAPVDQYLKAEIALVCFRLLAAGPVEADRARITARLENLLEHKMDYRGVSEFRRYADLYGQKETLERVLANRQ